MLCLLEGGPFPWCNMGKLHHVWCNVMRVIRYWSFTRYSFVRWLCPFDWHWLTTLTRNLSNECQVNILPFCLNLRLTSHFSFSTVNHTDSNENKVYNLSQLHIFLLGALLLFVFHFSVQSWYSQIVRKTLPLTPEKRLNDIIRGLIRVCWRL